VNRTPYSYRQVSTPSNLNLAGRAGRAVYKLPVGPSRLGQHVSDEATRGAFEALVAGQFVDLRVDWDGDDSSFGRFEVLVDASTWQTCELIDPSKLAIDVISPATTLEGATFRARFQRGPVYGGCIFGVKAVPIVWKQALPPQFDPSYVAVRGTDYEYEAGIQPDLVPWAYSVLAGGLHRLSLELSTERSYEVWVRLQHPTDSSRWQIQDPILHPIHGGGDPTSDGDGKVTA
jgi:hypothetical protein